MELNNNYVIVVNIELSSSSMHCIFCHVQLYIL